MTIRIGALIPVRLASSRLPGKALALIMGRAALHHLLDRCFACRYLIPETVIVCTTTDVEDDPLVPIVDQAGAQLFRGSRDDLIDRLHRATTRYGLDVIVEVDGDDICTDPSYMDACTERLINDPSLDLIFADGLPLGVSARVFRASALRRIFELYQPGKNDTGFMYYLTRSGLLNIERITPLSPEHCHASARLTLDYPEDLEFFRAVFQRLYRPGMVFGIEKICNLLKSEPQLLQINAGLDQKYWERTQALIDEQTLCIRTPDGVVQLRG